MIKSLESDGESIANRSVSVPKRSEQVQKFSRSTPITVSSRQLFQSAREVLIEHAGQVYRLRITLQNKLILNK